MTTSNLVRIAGASLVSLTLATIGCYNPYTDLLEPTSANEHTEDEDGAPTPAEACEHVLEIMSTADDSFEELSEEEQAEVMEECDADMSRLTDECGDQFEVMLQCVLDVEVPAEGSQGTAFYEAMAAVGACGEICESEGEESE